MVGVAKVGGYSASLRLVYSELTKIERVLKSHKNAFWHALGIEQRNPLQYAYFKSKGNIIKMQAIYSANPLPVELLPFIPIYGSSHIDGIQILEVADYPLNALVFVSQNLQKLAHAVGEICSTLQRRNTVFNLLISDCGTKMFLFPQVHLLVTGRHLHAWECGGYFMYNKSSDFDEASESEMSERLASVSIDDEGFQSLKQLCCGITAMIS